MNPTLPTPQLPIAYQLVLQLVPVYSAPVMIIPAPNTILPALSAPAPATPAIDDIPLPAEGPLATTRSPAEATPADQDSSPMPAADSPVHHLEDTPRVRLSPSPMDVTIHQLAANYPEWHYLAATQPISPPSSPTRRASWESSNHEDLHTPHCSLDNSMEREEPRSTQEGGASRTSSPITVVDSTDLMNCDLPDLAPGMLPYLLSSRTPSPFFDEFPVLMDPQSIEEAIHACDEPMDPDVNNNESAVPEPFADFDGFP